MSTTTTQRPPAAITKGFEPFTPTRRRAKGVERGKATCNMIGQFAFSREDLAAAKIGDECALLIDRTNKRLAIVPASRDIPQDRHVKVDRGKTGKSSVGRIGLGSVLTALAFDREQACASGGVFVVQIIDDFGAIEKIPALLIDFLHPDVRTRWKAKPKV